jgi:hypothetical protein
VGSAAICLSFAQAGAKLACINEFAAAETAAACGRHALVGGGYTTT